MSMERFLERMAESPGVTLNIPVSDDTGEITGYDELPIVVSDDSYRYRTIMGEHTLNLKFSLPGYYEIPIGTYCEYQGQMYTLETPENIKKNGERKFDYDLVFQSAQYQLSKFMLRNTVPGDTRLKFSYTARPGEFLRLLVDNLNARDIDEGWSYGEDYVEAYEKVVSFNHNTCSEALQMIAEAFETEWEVRGKTVYLRKVEYNKDNPLPLSYGKGNGFLPGLGRSEYSDVKAVERLFTQGGDRNIDSSKYRRTEATGQIGSSELLMPSDFSIKFDGSRFSDYVHNGTHYPEDDGFDPASPNVREYVTDESGASVLRTENRNRKGLIEGSLDCSEIYPMREGVVASVIEVNAEKNFYDFTDDDTAIPNYKEYLIDGETMTVIFQTGMLTGKEFDVAYKHPGRFEIVPQTIDGVDMPGGSYLPAVGDKYAIFNVMLPDEYLLEAERNMLRQAVRYLYDNEMPRFTFDGTLDAIWAKRDWENIGGRLVLGGFIRFSDTQFLPDGMDIRITGLKDYVNNPHKPQIELSNNSKSGSWVHNMKRQIESDEVLTDTKDRQVIQYAKRRFRDVRETTEMLQSALLDFSDPANPITMQTMQATIGDEMLQYDYSAPKASFLFDPGDEMTFHAPAGTLTHKTLGVNQISSSLTSDYPYFWDMPAFRSATLDDANQAYYLYAVVPDAAGGGVGLFELSTTGRDLRQGGNLNLLVGILNSEYGGTRSFAPLYGFTEILPGRITTGKIVSEDGENFFDLEDNALKLGDENSGLDWNISEDDTLTVKGLINALGAILGGFQIDNDKFQSLKKTGDLANILLNGNDGTGQLAGGNFTWDDQGNVTLSSNNTGSKIVIDSQNRKVQLINDVGFVSGEWTFSAESGSNITIRHSNGSSADLSSSTLRISRPNASSLFDGNNILTSTGSGSSTKQFWVNNFAENSYLNLTILGLPTSAPAGTPSGTVWRDGANLKIVP